MIELYVKAVLAGVFFGVWPLFMNRSGLSGNVSAVCFTAIALIGVLPFALHSNGLSIPVANWTMVALAGFFGALGLLFFNSMIAGASSQNVGTLYVLNLLMQVVVAASYQTIMSGHLSISKIGGYIAAAVAAYLLLR